MEVDKGFPCLDDRLSHVLSRSKIRNMLAYFSCALLESALAQLFPVHGKVHTRHVPVSALLGSPTLLPLFDADKPVVSTTAAEAAPTCEISATAAHAALIFHP